VGYRGKTPVGVW